MEARKKNLTNFQPCVPHLGQDREIQVISPKIRSPNSNGATAHSLSSFPRDLIHLIPRRFDRLSVNFW